MTPNDVLDRVDAIRAMAGDPEAAHGAEDDLWREVLVAIARGADDPIGLAGQAIQTTRIEFPRWCA